MTEKLPQNQPEKKEEQPVGQLRRDLKLFQGDKNSSYKYWMLYDPITDKYFRISENEYLVACNMHQPTTIEKIIKKLSHQSHLINKSIIIATVNFLNQNGLLVPAYKVTERRVTYMREVASGVTKKKIAGAYFNTMIPLCNPDRFLAKSLEILKIIFNKWSLMLIFAISLSGYIGVLIRWTRFSSDAVDSLSFQGLMRYMVALAFLKIFHELGHAYAAKNYGIRVRRFGIGFIFLMPRLFTDLTDSWTVTDKNKKILIDAAGIIVELIIGGFAALIWNNSGPGLTRSVAYYLFAISIINTVLVNGNPFLKYDGYYILMDFLKFDNLQTVASNEISIAFRRIFFGLKEEKKAHYKGIKRALLISYGICCFIYRIFLYSGIILLVYYKFTKVIGIILAYYEIHSLFVKPIIKEIKFVMKNKKATKKKHVLITSSSFILIILIIFVPLPWNISMPSMIISKDMNMVYLNTEGYLKNIIAEPGTTVKKDEILAEITNPSLTYEKRKQLLELKKLNEELHQSESDPEKIQESKIIERQIKATENEIIEITRKEQLLDIRATTSGYFMLFNIFLNKGKYFEKGDVIGEIGNPDKKIVLAYCTEKQREMIEINEEVTVTINNELKKSYGKISSISAVPKKDWNTSPLLNIYGGPIKVTPSAKNPNLYIADTSYYEVLVKLDKNSTKNVKILRTGTVYIREFTSIGFNWLKALFVFIQKLITF